MFVTSNFEGRFTRVSPSVTRLLGYSREEFLARPLLEQIHPDDVEPLSRRSPNRSVAKRS